MKVLILGATGMIGQGVLREALLDPEIDSVVTLGRRPTGQQHPKLTELVHSDLFNLTPIESSLTSFDACLFCLGVTSLGISEAEYRHLTYDLTLGVAQTLVRLNPQMTFVYVTGVGTDSTERGSSAWARVKGKTENDLLKLPFKAAYMFRPGYIQPLHGIKTKTWWYGAIYTMFGSLYPIWKRLLPGYVTTTEVLGRGMLTAAKHGAPKPILEVRDINALRC
ncbi:MAG: NAD-dependent epimerase/dehydratase family protein [Bryobacteraceae bacterium]